jgi:hypothetical protein
MMTKVGLTSKEIEDTRVVDVVDREWLKEIAWQLAKLREDMWEQFREVIKRDPAFAVLTTSDHAKINLGSK